MKFLMNFAAARLLVASAVFLCCARVSSASPKTAVSIERARTLAAASPSERGFSVVVNEEVLVQLNRYLSSPGSRKSLRAALARMEDLRPMLERESRIHETPWELMAIPLVESRFGNPTEKANAWRSAGLWQFMRGSARSLGLAVNAKQDERLDPAKATRAALKYLKSHYEEFKNWSLALLAYNAGAGRVRKGIAATSSRDAFEIIAAGHKGGDPEYLAKVMASVILLKNPSLLGDSTSQRVSGEPSTPTAPPR